MLESRSKAQKTWTRANKNLSEILWLSGWALGQVTWAKWSKNYFTYDVTHNKSATTNHKFFCVQIKQTKCV